ncbi:MAG: hypothetical protein IKE85_05455 [Mogibacterium sp.]|nr:hypothetical protein [Mogibacterium sp.]
MLKEYTKRLAICIGGLALFAVGTVFGVLAGSAGTNGWNTMALGLSNTTGMSFGTAVFCISAGILIIDFIGKGKLGIGTFLNAFLIAWLSDVFLKVMSFVPEPPNVAVGVLYTLFGQMIIAFSTVIYMSTALGAGPRDTLMVITSKALPRLPIGVVKFILEIGALIAGVLMGAPFGIGTVLVITLQASFFQFACQVTRFVPRDVRNEDLLDTWRRITGKQHNTDSEDNNDN